MVLTGAAVFYYSPVYRPCTRKTKLRFPPFHPRQATVRVKVIAHFQQMLGLRKSGIISTRPSIRFMSCAWTNIDSKSLAIIYGHKSLQPTAYLHL